VNAIPLSLRNAIGAGIGIYVAFIGLQSSGVVVCSEDTIVSLGNITSGSALLTIIGTLLTGFLFARNVPGAILLGIIITMIIGIPMGVTEFMGIVSRPESIEPIFCQFEWDKILSVDMLVIVFTFLFIDLFDTVGTLVGVCTKAKLLDKNGNIYRIKEAFMADSIATTAGAMLGTSTTTTYVESATGISQGGRSGLTAFAVAVCFVVALFFSPLFLSIPAAATTPALVIVGLLMLEPIVKIPFGDYSESIPAFICIIMIPLSYSISNGIMLGMISYVVLNVLCGKFKKITPAMYVLAVLFVLKFIFI
jgi:AGZA family xanthine/uracil permease-like MFS transporter